MATADIGFVTVGGIQALVSAAAVVKVTAPS